MVALGKIDWFGLIAAAVLIDVRGQGEVVVAIAANCYHGSNKLCPNPVLK